MWDGHDELIYVIISLHFGDEGVLVVFSESHEEATYIVLVVKYCEETKVFLIKGFSSS
jgi:hypothetical protein